MPLGIYLHIPFCSAICTYCNFNRGLLDEPLKRRYVRALAVEIERAGSGARGCEADTIYFGGGTPSLLDPEEARGLIDACRRAFRVRPGSEITLETNPETVTLERLEAFREAGVTRLSIGVQSFHDDELRRLGRLHSADRAAGVVDLARRAGFDNVSLDLMFWLPEQTEEHWFASVDRAIALGPDHVSLYLLELYPNAPIRDQMARCSWSQAGDEDAADMYVLGLARLEEAGYRQYELSNVARPGFESRHNLKYWTDGEWLGCGCGAHSTRQGYRWRNVSGTAEYVERIERGASPELDRRLLPPAERLGDAMFTGLRLTAGLDLDAVSARHGVDVWARYAAALAPYFDAGLLVRDAGRLRLTRRGMLLANEVMTVFV